VFKHFLLLNGLAIVGVVFSHASQWVYLAMFWWADRWRAVSVPNYDQLGSLSYYGIVILQKIGVFAVPAFLFTSGFFIAYAARGKSTLTWRMVGVRIRNLLIPYFIWTFVIFAGEFLQGITYPPIDYLRRLVLGDAVPAYYYVFLLCQLYVLSPLLVPIAKTRGRGLLIASAAILLGVIGLFYLKLYGELAGVQLPAVDRAIDLIPTRSSVRFIFFFILGLVAGLHLQQFKQWLARFRWVLLIIALVTAPLAVLETELIFRSTGMDWRGGIFTMTGSVYALSFILAFMAFGTFRIPFSAIIQELGRASFGIYLLHSTVLEFFARSAQKFLPWLLASPLLFLCMLVVVGVGVPFLLMKAFARSPFRKYYRYLFG